MGVQGQMGERRGRSGMLQSPFMFREELHSLLGISYIICIQGDHIHQPFKNFLLGCFKHECILSSLHGNPQPRVSSPLHVFTL